MPDPSEIKHVANPLQSWLSQGEQLYASALNEYRALEAQLDDLEQKLAAKQEEVNQIAAIINKPPVDSARRLPSTMTADIIDAPAERLPIPVAPGPHGTPNKSSNATIARALTGKFGR